MNNFGERITIVKPNRIRPVLVSLIKIGLLAVIYLFIRNSIETMLMFILFYTILTPVLFVMVVVNIISIIITTFDRKTIEMYKYGIKINNFICPYKKLTLYICNSIIDKKLIFKTSIYSKVVRGYIEPNDYNLILSKIKPYTQNKPIPENDKEALKIIIKPDKRPYILFILLSSILTFRLSLYFLLLTKPYILIIILLLFIILFSLILTRIDKQKIYLYNSYLQIDEFIAPYNALNIEVSSKFFFKRLLFTCQDKTKLFNYHINKMDLDFIAEKIRICNFNFK